MMFLDLVTDNRHSARQHTLDYTGKVYAGLEVLYGLSMVTFTSRGVALVYEVYASTDIHIITVKMLE